MIRNLKVLGLAVVAVFAMSAMVASAAQAAPYWFKSDGAAGSTTKLVGEQKERTGGLIDEFTTTAGVVKCTKTHYTGNVTTNTVTTVTIHPEYTGCTAFGFPATVTVAAGCNYVFHTEEATAGGIYHSTVTLDCSSGDITVVAAIAGVTKCTVHVTPQDVGTVTLTNGVKKSGVKDVHADIDLSGIKYTETAGTGGGACLSTKAGEDAANGTYKGTATLSGFNNTTGAETDIFLE